ncbi:MAG: 3-dehydroquinate synthase [bacterium]|nr:3-dehydroquinate synthase [bacterium]
MNIIPFDATIPHISYPIYLEKSEILREKLDELNYSNFCIVSDTNTGIYAQKYGLKGQMINVPCGENAKSLKTAEKIYKKLADSKATRRSTVIVGIGGGAICDLTGYVAMTYMRGIPYVLIPTTLVAMTDAAIGAKVAVNSPEGSKNLIGGFYPPLLVQIDRDTLKTLPYREYLSAFGEIIKVACIADDDGRFFDFLETNIKPLVNRSTPELSYALRESIQIKIKQVEPDLTETNLDRLLNLGHAVAHSIETVSNYSMLHGECVAIGIAQAALVGLKRGKTPARFVERLTNLIKGFQLPDSFPGGLSRSKFRREMHTVSCVRDGDLREVIPVSPGRSLILHHISPEEMLNFN